VFIKELEVQNFKSFEAFHVDLNNFNVLIGANASGKSNFIRIFKFLRNIVQYNLNDAISIEGGVEYLRNITIGNKGNLRLKLRYAPDEPLIQQPKQGQIDIRIPDASYEFEISFHKRGKGFQIVKDLLTITYRFAKTEKRLEGPGSKVEDLGEGRIVYRLVREEIKVEDKILPANISLGWEDISPLYGLFDFGQKGMKLPAKTLFLETPFFGLAHNWFIANPLASVAIYDFDPKLSQRAVAITGKTELEEDASNLSLVLKGILADPEQKRKFMNLVNYLLPFIGDYSVVPQADKSFLFALRENHNSSSYLPAFLLSDGTVNLTALIVALYFTDNPLLILEEPERTVHPSLIAKMVELFEEISTDKQIIITTHNPEVVRNTPIDNLLLIARDERGFSQVQKPAQSENVQIFLQNEIGMQDLYVQNLLGV
jgi:predicted ATPase